MMKGFKLLIVGLCSLLGGIISFCNAFGIVNYSGSDSVWLRPDFNGCDGYISCSFNNSSNMYFTLVYEYYNSLGQNSSSSIGSQLVSVGGTYIYHFNRSDCSNSKVIGLRDIDGISYNCYIYGDFISSSGGGSCPECPTCPEINTGEILSGYILESDIDNLYCEEHGYCPLIDTGLDNTGVEWSALYINEIQHNSAPLINITIPEEFDWDYSGSDEEFNLEVKGYNVDTEYVDGLIRSQNFKPNSDDFSSILTGLVPLFVPGLVIILFLYFVFRLFKKVF